ncbi:hypothetical protein AN928_19985 [Pseudomonas aeruginosa]|nr:hypothetical protein AN928_19985 [Pseudomonas aeruginosa]
MHDDGNFQGAESFTLARGGRNFQEIYDQGLSDSLIEPCSHSNQQINITVWLQATVQCRAVQMHGPATLIPDDARWR